MSEDTNKKWDDSLISMGLGALVVVVSGILLFNYFNNQAPKLIKDQGQKSVAVSSSMPKISDEHMASSSARAIAQVSSSTPKASPTAQPTATPKATVTPKPSELVKASVKPSETPKATTVAQASSAPITDTKTLPTNYTVQSGDSLWAVSQRFYGTGYEWKHIASANNIAGSYRLTTGQVITVPKVAMISATSTDKSQIAQATPVATQKPAASVTPAPAVGGATITPQTATAPQGSISYTVAHGDSLWSIAVAQCNNGYAWSSIAKQNKISHPGTIHAGNTFTFTCS